MRFPIDKETFDRIRDNRSPIIRKVDINNDELWKYWMDDESEDVFALLGDFIILFQDIQVDLTISSNEWNLTLISLDKPKEVIKNHLHRGGNIYENYQVKPSIVSGLYELECSKIKKKYQIYIDVELERDLNWFEVYLWWPGKSDLLTSLPLIYEMTSFYNTALWKKF